MIIPAPSSDIAFSILGFPVYFYGITMAVAIFFAMITGNCLYNTVQKSLRKDIIIEFSPIIIFSGILGARLYFCILNWEYYFLYPLQILDIRQGGLSVHGAVIGGVLSMFLIARRLKVPAFSIIDALSCSTILGQAIGRWGNYFNSEAYGIPVASQKWGLFIPPDDRIARYSDFSLFHPTFLYESVFDIVGFIILLFIYLKLGKKYRGITFFAYLILYSMIRFFIEQLRIDSALNIGAYPIAQIVSVVLFVIGLIGMIFVLVKPQSET